MSDAMSGVNQMVSDLNKSITAAVDRVKAQQEAQAAASANVQEFRKDVRKSASNTIGAATDMGVLAKNVTRLNVVGALGANDPVDFYKFRVTTKGEVTLGQIGDEGTRVQVMSKLGTVIADSSKDAGKQYDNFKGMMQGDFSLDKGDYTLRITRDKGQSPKDTKNYAIQLSMGSYTQDYDTVAKAPLKGQSAYSLSTGQQAMLDGLNSAMSSLNSIPTGQSGTQKLMGSFNLFV
ncbi:hypothetical protein [Azospirillum rugosum]|uniref:Uncharacterized protein n=1 Tax=Azospirillum rugosum TaxID=416170 RepID=A0ABS4SJI6_9PROT|nr:hypothetical protein [Azospirillum rugosum]MBP2292724.1 hypothetical protein [Azospirillum rugosum]MDQ0526252.1 hypothetical protein [Azospirillum rugosum]